MSMLGWSGAASERGPLDDRSVYHLANQRYPLSDILPSELPSTGNCQQSELVPASQQRRADF
jgi:hypothetical protein